MNYTLLILFLLFLLTIYKFTKQKENFTKLKKKKCKKCRMKLSKKKRDKGETIEPIEILKECINKKQCVKNDICTYCVKKVAKNTEDSSTDPNLDKTFKMDDNNFTVDLNNCKKFRYCRDEFENGICNTEKWNKEGGDKYCCNPCVSEIRKNIDEADESALNIAKTCMTNLKLDEEKLWNNEYDIHQGVCSLTTINRLKDNNRNKKNKKIKRRVNAMKRMRKKRRRMNKKKR